MLVYSYSLSCIVNAGSMCTDVISLEFAYIAVLCLYLQQYVFANFLVYLLDYNQIKSTYRKLIGSKIDGVII